MALNWKIKAAIVLALVGTAFLLPHVASSFYDRLLVLCLIWAILAMSLNLYLGYLGGLSLAYSAFFGLAGYTSGLLCVELGWATGVGLLGAIGICVVVAILLGIPSLRLKGAYFVMITIAFLGIVGGLSIALNNLTNGTTGLRGIPNIAIGVGDTVGAEDLIKLDGIELYLTQINEIKLYEKNLASLKTSGVDRADIEDYYQNALDDKTDDYEGKISDIEDYQTGISEFDFAGITLTEILGEIRFYYSINLDETNVAEILSDIKSSETALDEIFDESSLEDLQAIRTKLKSIDRVETKINGLTNVDNLDAILDEIHRLGFDVEEIKKEDHTLSDLKEHYVAELDNEKDYYEERLQEFEDKYTTIIDASGLNDIFNGLIDYYETELVDTTLYYENQLEKTKLSGAEPEETELPEADVLKFYSETRLDALRLYYETALDDTRVNYLVKLDATKFNETILYYKTELTETVSYYQDQLNELEAQQEEIITPDDVALLYENKQDEILDKLALDYGINLDQIKAGDGKLSARLAERTPKDPTTDAFYKTGIHFQTTTSFYWLALIFLVVTYILVYRLLNSRVGRGFVAVRDNEDLANSLGIYPFKYKMTGFIVSAVIAGVAGWLYAHYLNIMDPTVFNFDLLFKIMFMVIIGGTGTLVGPALGAFVVVFVPELFTEYIYSVDDAWSTAALSVFLLVVIIAWPDGIWGSTKRRVLKYHYRKKGMVPELELEQGVSPVSKVVQPVKDLFARVLRRKK